MSAVAIGLIGIAALLALFMIGMPVGFAMAVIGIAGFSLLVSLMPQLPCLREDVWTSFLTTH